jgi:hypothetical protein
MVLYGWQQRKESTHTAHQRRKQGRGKVYSVRRHNTTNNIEPNNCRREFLQQIEQEDKANKISGKEAH